MVDLGNYSQERIEDLCIKVTSGGTPSRKNPDFYTGDIPWLKTGELKGWFVYDAVEKITQEAINKSSAKTYPKNTVLMAMYGDGKTIGSVAITAIVAASNQASCAMIVNQDKCLPLFLFYSLKHYRETIVNLALGGAQRNLNQGTIKNFEINCPLLSQQKKIVDTLSNYDNLIENNNRRIAILEDMAQSLYREWFVNFRYPGHADAVDQDGNQKLIDSPLGQIPEGWEVKSAAEAININPSTKLTKDGEKPFVGMSGLSEGTMVIGDIIEKTGNSGAKFINRDTLFARITPCLQNGKTGFVQFLTPEQPIGFGSTEFIVLRESEYLSSEFIYLLSRSNNFREHAIQSMTGATGRQRVHNDCFASYYLAVPPKELMNEFTKMVQPMFKSIFNLSKRNQNLKQQRDMLLPKLISGQIEL
jgi:type I restriction enzyme S subunit